MASEKVYTMREEEAKFRKDRRKGIGGSDWGQTEELGGRCTRALIYEKRGVEPDFPIDVVKQGYFDRGHALEPVIADLAEKELGIKLRAGGKPPKTKLPEWWVGNIDRRVVRGGVFEAKSKGPFPFKSLVRNGVPVGEILQCQHYMALYKQKIALHFALEPVTWNYHETYIEFDDDLIRDMIVLGNRIWRMVTEGPLPERLDATSKLCQECPWRFSCQGDALYKAQDIDRATGDIIEVDEGDLLDIQEEILENKALIKELGDRVEELNADAKKLIGKPQTILVAGRAVHFLASNRTSFDSKRFRVEHAVLAEKYLKTKVVESMRWM